MSLHVVLPFSCLVGACAGYFMLYRPSRTRQKPQGKVYLVGAGPGAHDLISVRGFRLVQQADVIVHDRLVSPELLREASKDCRLVNVGKSAKKERFPQSSINEILVKEANANPDAVIVRLKGGDPFVFGLGGDEVIALANANIPVEVVPGITSAIAVPASVGIPVTQKSVSTSFTVLSGHLSPGADGAADWERVPMVNSTLVVLMGTKNLPKICEFLVGKGWSPETSVAVVHSGTTADQTCVRGDLSTIHDQVQQAQLKPPCTIVIGDVCDVIPKGVVSPPTTEEESYDLFRRSRSQVWGIARK